MTMSANDWTARGLEVFGAPKPENCTECGCMECMDHEATLKPVTVHTITMQEVGQPGWSAISMSNTEAKKYFLPALIRLAGSPTEGGDALEMLLLVIAGNWGDNDRVLRACDARQRRFVCDYLADLIENHGALMDAYELADDLLAAHTLWSDAA